MAMGLCFDRSSGKEDGVAVKQGRKGGKEGGQACGWDWRAYWIIGFSDGWMDYDYLINMYLRLTIPHSCHILGEVLGLGERGMAGEQY